MATTIKQLLVMPIGQKWGGETFTIKTAKKKLPVKDIWWQQVIFIDSEGSEMPADVKIVKNIPLIAGSEIKIIVAKIENAEYLGKDRKKLVVDQFSIPTQTADEFQSKQDELNREVQLIVESKVRCWLTSSFVEGYAQREADVPAPTKENKKYILEWQEFVISGE